jgi:hypothetical protein
VDPFGREYEAIKYSVQNEDTNLRKSVTDLRRDSQSCEIPHDLTHNLSLWETGRRRLSLPCERSLTVGRHFAKTVLLYQNILHNHPESASFDFVTAMLRKNKLIILGLLLHPDHRGITILRNVGNC